MGPPQLLGDQTGTPNASFPEGFAILIDNIGNGRANYRIRWHGAF